MEKDSSGMYAHIHGIDNDFSFSTGTKLEMDCGWYSAYGNKMRSVVRPDKNELVIPYMDKQLAISIKYFSSDMVRFALKDLLSEGYIKQTITRIENVKEAIENEKGGFDSPRFKKDSEWNDKTAINMLQKSSFTKSVIAGKKLFDEGFNMQSTYFTEMLLYSIGTDGEMTKFEY